jgi:hypothetical protein
MANIVQGMFGVSPSQIMQERNDTGYAQDLKAVQLDPLQQANLMLRQGGRSLGREVIAPMLGIQDQELQKTQMAQQLASQFEMTTPDGLMQYAQALAQNGMPEFAQIAATKAQTMRSQAAEVGLKQAQTVKALREPDAGIASLIGKSTPESVAAYKQSGNVADLVLTDKGLTGTTLEKVSAANQNIENLSTGNAAIDSWMKKVDPANPSVTFGPGSTIGAGVSRLVGSPTENAQEQSKLRRFISREANAILLSAKGTQTEGDAQRAYDMIMSNLDKNSNEDVYSALEDLKTMKLDTVKGLKTYVGSMTSKGKGAATEPQAPASGEYKDDYAKYVEKYGNTALPYAAYAAKRKKQAQ